MISYASYTRETTEPLKAYAHSRRMTQAAEILKVSPTDILLDYGCADAHLFSIVTAATMIGYDPDPKMLAQMDPTLSGKVRLYGSVTDLMADRTGQFTLISCMEVCEHMTDTALNKLLLNIKQLCSPGARVVFGVPIETGLSGFLKGIYRVSKGGRQDATLGRSIKALASIPLDRRESDVEWYGSHTGFNDRLFAKEILRFGFVIEETTCLPFPFGRLLNNEIYYVCRASR